jgi:hypothetical protein
MGLSLKPSENYCAIADIDGGLWLSADLLTYCMEEGDTYHAIAVLLATLPITLLRGDRFPLTELI